MDLAWVDPNCGENHYATLSVSSEDAPSVTENTYVGHVWRARDASTHALLREVVALDAAPATVHVVPISTTAETMAAPNVEDDAGHEVSVIDLVDWEGRVANPTRRLRVRAPAGARLPARATVYSDSPRLYFDLPSSVTSNGSKKDFVLTDGTPPSTFRIALYGDGRGQEQRHSLTVRVTDADGNESCVLLPVRVDEKDPVALVSAPPPFKVHIDFSPDTTGFFKDAEKRAIVQRAADDWAYFIADMGLDAIAVGTERTWVWDASGFVTGRSVTNRERYDGYLLYAEGIHTTALRSGGAGSYEGGLQSSRGSPLPLRRSGQLTMETEGNFNTLGWLVSADPATWRQATNGHGVPNDLYSIAHHEIGHALFFDDAHPGFAKAKAAGGVHSAALTAYLGGVLSFNGDNHTSAVDPVSGVGVFGNEYNGVMPALRWQITKTDLLALQALGYRLRTTTVIE